jgi:indolepyruvate ferredoxin oxidoreductase
MKIVTNVADGTGTACISPERLNFVTPDLEFDGKLFTPNMNLGMNVRAEALEMEQSLYTRRLEVAKRYARANKLNNVVFPNPDAWIGIITAGKTSTTSIRPSSRWAWTTPRCAATASAS